MKQAQMEELLQWWWSTHGNNNYLQPVLFLPSGKWWISLRILQGASKQSSDTTRIDKSFHYHKKYILNTIQAPILCLGLYQAKREKERNEKKIISGKLLLVFKTNLVSPKFDFYILDLLILFAKISISNISQDQPHHHGIFHLMKLFFFLIEWSEK